MLDFGAAQSFLKEDNCGKIFSFNIVNSGSSAIKVALAPGNFATGSSYLDSSNIIAEGTVATDLTCSGTPEKIDALLAYVKANPSRLRAIKIKADNESQLDLPIIYRNVNPFKGYADEKRIPAQYQRSGDNNTKVIELTDIDWILGADNILMTTIGAGRSVVISLIFGASLDTEKQDLAILRKASHEKFLEAYAMLYPETKATASPIYYFQNGFESTQEKIDRLGIDPDFNSKYTADPDNFEKVTSETVTLSYKHILKWVGYIAIIIATLVALWYFYKKMK